MDNTVISTGGSNSDEQKAVFIDPKVQQELNTPWKDNTPINPADQAFLREVQLSAEEFTALVMASADDDEVIKRMKAHPAKKGK